VRVGKGRGGGSWSDGGAERWMISAMRAQRGGPAPLGRSRTARPRGGRRERPGSAAVDPRVRQSGDGRIVPLPAPALSLYPRSSAVRQSNRHGGFA
jgi:hypothetical protein